MTAHKFCIAAFIAFCLCSSASAQDAVMEAPKQVQLTPDMVKRYVAVLGEIRKWQAANETTSKTDEENEEEEGGEDYGNAAALMKLAKGSPEVRAILKKNNFEDIEKFGEIAQSVESAYDYANPESGMADIESNIRKSIEQIRDSKDYSDEERAEAIKGLENDAQSVQRQKPLPGNVDVVKPFVAEIKKIEESE